MVTFPGSSVGKEAAVLHRQLERFMAMHPEIRVEQQQTPDQADQRHLLYVQWMNARANQPDILQLDVVWTAEFANAGWILSLDRFSPVVDDFFPITIDADRWDGRLYALPWFVDVSMLYWRTDLLDGPPTSQRELSQMAERARTQPGATDGQIRYGLVWSGSRHEGLTTVFVTYLGAYGGKILDGNGNVVVDSAPAVRALAAMCRAVQGGIVPKVALTWDQEKVRFAFQNGHALFMLNWPYAYADMERDRDSVAGGFAVTSMPAATGGAPSAALGGQQLAINARSDHPEAAYEVIKFLTQPPQMLERAEMAGQYPPRPSLYEGDALEGAIAIPPAEAREIIEQAIARPVTPLYSELSEQLQVRLHRALIGELSAEDALADGARVMRQTLARLKPGAAGEASGDE